jgi:hypothetical protein
LIHPSLVMLAFGTGVVGLAGGGIFLLDRSTVERRLVDVRSSEEQKRLQDAGVQDVAAAVVLGVVGGVGVATGVTLLMISLANE